MQCDRNSSFRLVSTIKRWLIAGIQKQNLKKLKNQKNKLKTIKLKWLFNHPRKKSIPVCQRVHENLITIINCKKPKERKRLSEKQNYIGPWQTEYINIGYGLESLIANCILRRLNPSQNKIKIHIIKWMWIAACVSVCMYICMYVWCNQTLSYYDHVNHTNQPIQ